MTEVCNHDLELKNTDKDGSQVWRCRKCGIIYTQKFFPRRRTVLIIENDIIGDEIWTPYLVKRLRDYANYYERAMGSGGFPQCLRSSGGDNITIYSGTYCEELPLDEESLQQQL